MGTVHLPASPGQRTAAPRASHLPKFGSPVILAVELAVVIVAWQLVVDVFHLVNPVFLPAPWAIFAGFADIIRAGDFWPNVSSSFVSYVLGLGLATIVGVIGGLVLGTFVIAGKLAGPVVWTIYAIPWLAYRPLSVVWFGFGIGPIVFLAFMAAVFPILINTAAGVRTVSSSLISAGRVFGANRVAIFRKIVLPSTVPLILVGVRQAAVLAVLGVLVAEMTGSSVGVGALISLNTNKLQTPQAYAAICMAIIWTFIVGECLRLLGSRLRRWNAPETAR